MKKFIKPTLILLLTAITLLMYSCSISDEKDERTEDIDRVDKITSADNGWLESPDTSTPENSTEAKDTEAPDTTKEATTEEVTTRVPETEAPSFIFVTRNNGYSVSEYQGKDKQIVIPSYYEGYPVVGIESNAFKNSAITSVSIPDTITYIGDYAFYGSQISSVTIHKNVSYMGKGVFENCKQLTSVDYNAINCEAGWITENNPLGWNTYKYLYYLSSEPIFMSCNKLTDINVGNSVEIIPPCLFYGCTNVKNITISYNVEKIYYGAFGGCKNIDKVDFLATNAVAEYNYTGYGYPDTVNIFDGNIATLNFGSSVYKINKNIFYGSSTKEIYVSDNVCYIDDYAFNGCNPEKLVLGNRIDDAGCIPYSVKTLVLKGFTEIDGYDIPNSDTLTTLILENVEHIKGVVFSDCPGLENLSIPDSILSIESLKECKLIEYNIYENGYYLGNESNPYAYYVGPIESNNSYKLHPSTKCIGRLAFNNQTALTSFDIPQGIRSIDCGAFQGCSNLKNVTLPDSICYIGSYAFNNCYALTSIELPTNIDTIYEYTFKNAPLSSIVIPEGVVTIENDAFKECKSLTQITLPETIRFIDRDAFKNCNLIRVDFKTWAPWCYMEECGITPSNTCQLYINNESVGDTIVIPEGVTAIREYAFEDFSNITTVSIPKSLQSIGSYAFYNCTKLTKINYNGTKAEWNSITKRDIFEYWDTWNKNTGEYIIYCTDGRIAK
ncbi:MAG: leucine-rich repeat protein [Clostridia bacterium]|nr:leucine-rich repeat protein [Clostridia bacterium]